MDDAIWYVISDGVWMIAGGTFALAFLISILLLIIGGSYQPRFNILGGNGVFSRRAHYGGDE